MKDNRKCRIKSSNGTAIVGYDGKNYYYIIDGKKNYLQCLALSDAILETSDILGGRNKQYERINNG